MLADDDGDGASRDSLPLDGYLREHFVIRAYSDAEEIVDAALVGPSDAAATVERLFDRTDTAFLHVRFPTYGCFAMRARVNAATCHDPKIATIVANFTRSLGDFGTPLLKSATPRPIFREILPKSRTNVAVDAKNLPGVTPVIAIVGKNFSNFGTSSSR